MSPRRNALSPVGLYLASCAGLIAGVLLFSRGYRLPGGPDVLLVPLLLAGLPLLFLRVENGFIRRTIYPMLFLLCLGHGLRFTADPEKELQRAYPGVEPELPGWISGFDPPKYGKFRTRLRLATTNTGTWKETSWEALLECPRKWEGLTIGDRVVVRGKMESTLAVTNVSYRAWLLSQEIAWRVKVAADPDLERVTRLAGRWPHWTSPVFFRALHHRMVGHMTKKFEAHMGQPAAGLSLGLVTGLKSGLPPEISDDFRKTGTLHVLAVSGSHAVVLAALFYALFRFVGMGRHLAMGLLLFGIFPPYLFLTAFQISIVRTWIMAVTLWAFDLAGRDVKPRVILAMAFLLVALADPAQLAMVSFQLSFAAVWGMGTAMSFLKTKGWTRGWMVYLGVSLGAQLFTAPLLLFHFGWLHPLSLFYNTLILYTIPLSLIYSLILWLCPLDGINTMLGHTLYLLNHGTYQLVHGFRTDGAIWTWERGGGLFTSLAMGAGILGFGWGLGRLLQPKPPTKPRFPPWPDRSCPGNSGFGVPTVGILSKPPRGEFRRAPPGDHCG